MNKDHARVRAAAVGQKEIAKLLWAFSVRDPGTRILSKNRNRRSCQKGASRHIAILLNKRTKKSGARLFERARPGSSGGSREEAN